MTFSLMTPGIMTFSLMTLGIMTFSLMTLSIKNAQHDDIQQKVLKCESQYMWHLAYVTLSICDTQHM
jgi:hypothetical protein